MTTGAKDRFKRAEQAARKGNYEYAVELYLQGLTLDPKAIERRRLHEVEVMAIQEQGGNPEGSVRTKMKSMPIVAKAKKLSLQKKWEDLVPELERAIRMEPRNTSLLVQLAEALQKIEAEDSAIDVYEEVIANDHNNIDALRGLGQLWGKKEETEKAVEYWEKVRMIKPDDKEAAKAIRDLSAANMVRRAEDRKKKSGDDSFKAMLKDEDESAELEKKSKVIRTDEDRREAIEYKKEEIKNEPTNSRLWRDLAALYADLHEYKHAFAAYKKAMEVNPHDLFARDKIGSLREQIAHEQLEALRAKLKVAASNGGASDELTAELEKREREFLEFRVKEYSRRVKEHPTDYDLKLRLGRVLMEDGQYDPAIEQFQKAVKDPKYRVQAQMFMGLCFKHKGVFSVAINQFKDALKATSDPDSDVGKEIRYNLAVAYQENGEVEAALEQFQQIMSIDISYQDVSQRVAALMTGTT